MKMRQGFVSNSSSSSFIIGSKGKLTKEKLEQIYPVPKGTPFEWIFKDMIDTVFGEANDQCYESLEDYMREKDEKESDVDPLVKELFEKGFIVYTGRLGTDNGEIEWITQNTAISFKSDVLVMEHDGRF